MMRAPADAYTMLVRVDENGRIVSRQFAATYLSASQGGQETVESITQQAFSYARRRRPEICRVTLVVPASLAVAVE